MSAMDRINDRLNILLEERKLLREDFHRWIESLLASILKHWRDSKAAGPCPWMISTDSTGRSSLVHTDEGGNYSALTLNECTQRVYLPLALKGCEIDLRIKRYFHKTWRTRGMQSSVKIDEESVDMEVERIEGGFSRWIYRNCYFNRNII